MAEVKRITEMGDDYRKVSTFTISAGGSQQIEKITTPPRSGKPPPLERARRDHLGAGTSSRTPKPRIYTETGVEALPQYPENVMPGDAARDHVEALHQPYGDPVASGREAAYGDPCLAPAPAAARPAPARILALLIILIVAGAGFALHVLWWIAIAELIIWLLGFLFRQQGWLPPGPVGSLSSRVRATRERAAEGSRCLGVR